MSKHSKEPILPPQRGGSINDVDKHFVSLRNAMSSGGLSTRPLFSSALEELAASLRDDGFLSGIDSALESFDGGREPDAELVDGNVFHQMYVFKNKDQASSFIHDGESISTSKHLLFSPKRRHIVFVTNAPAWEKITLKKLLKEEAGV